MPDTLPRRGFLQWMVYGVGAIAGVVLAIPIVGYLLGPLRKSPDKEYNLGPIDEVRFPINETRLHTFENPIRQPWDGMVAHVGVYVRNLGKDESGKHKFWVFAMNCAHLGCPVS